MINIYTDLRKDGRLSITANSFSPKAPTTNVSHVNAFHTIHFLKISFMRKIVAFLSIAVLALFTTAKAQIAVTVTGASNTTPALSASYTTLSDALNGLNAVTAMTGPVTFSLAAGSSETAPLTGFTVGSATLNPVLSATNTVTIVKDAGAATVLNAAGGGTTTPASAAPNGILKIVGADYVTIDGLTLTDGNTANPASMEFGLGIFKASATDGAQNNTIQNCIINMQRVNNASGTAPMVEGSVGILMINSTPTAATTALTVTAASGANSNNKFYSNTINSGNYGMALIGFAGATPFTTCDQGNIVGALGLGNSILNFGGGAATNPAAGIRTLAQYGISVGYNTVNNNNGSGVNHATTLRGIYLNTATSANATITNNTVSIQGGATTSTVSAIDNQSGSTAASNTINITNNTVNIGYPTATSGVYNGIINGSSAATVNINGNTIGQISGVALAGTGTCVMIEGGSPGGVLNTNNNIVANINRTGASGSWRGIKAITPVGLWTASGNTVENLNWTTVTSTGSIDGIYDLSSAPLITITGNTVRNLSTPTTGTINGISINTVSGTHSCTNNQVYNFTTTAGGAGGATFTGIVFSVGNATVTGNTIYSLNSTGTTGGTGGSIQGIRQGGGTTNLIAKNKIYDLSSTSTNPTVIGINSSGGTTTTVQNNLIGDLRATAANAANAIRGIDVANTTTNLYYNTVYINGSSSGAVFGTSAINTSTSTTLDMRNNIFVNLSSFNTTGLTVAYRRSTTTLTSYANTSNNNFFYAGTPGAGNLIFNDGTNSDQTMGAFQTRVSPRDNASVSETVSSTAGVFFQSFTGADATFLHMVAGLTTQVESGASVIGSITDDFDGDVRSLVKPDMGADEFSGSSPAPTITFNSITPATTQCVATSRLVSVSATSPGVTTITGVSITYNNGAGAVTFPMTNTSGNIWEYTIPAALPTNTVVTWSATATNSIALTATYVGASYQDDPLLGGVGSATATPATVCSGSTSNLTATFVIPNQSKTIGTGGSASSTTAASFFPGNWGGAKTQYIIRASELTAAGLGAGDITSLSFETTNSGQTYQGFTVQMGHTAQTDMTTTFIASGLTQVYKGTLTDDGYTPLVGVQGQGHPLHLHGMVHLIL
jgi:trimeric autotransporter adhesin